MTSNNASSPGRRISLGERLAYSIVLGAIVLMIVILIPSLIWPDVMGVYVAGPTWLVILLISYLITPFLHRYTWRTKYE